MKVSLETILAEIAAAGPQQEPEGERLTDRGILVRVFDLCSRINNKMLPPGDRCEAQIIVRIVNQLRSDLARLAAEIGRRDAVLRVILDAGEDGWSLKLALAMDQARKILEPLK